MNGGFTPIEWNDHSFDQERSTSVGGENKYPDIEGDTYRFVITEVTKGVKQVLSKESNGAYSPQVRVRLKFRMIDGEDEADRRFGWDSRSATLEFTTILTPDFSRAMQSNLTNFLRKVYGDEIASKMRNFDSIPFNEANVQYPGVDPIVGMQIRAYAQTTIAKNGGNYLQVTLDTIKPVAKSKYWTPTVFNPNAKNEVVVVRPEVAAVAKKGNRQPVVTNADDDLFPEVENVLPY